MNMNFELKRLSRAIKITPSQIKFKNVRNGIFEFEVQSQTGRGSHTVEILADKDLICTCEDFVYTQKPCKHGMAISLRRNARGFYFDVIADHGDNCVKLHESWKALKNNDRLGRSTRSRLDTVSDEIDRFDLVHDAIADRAGIDRTERPC